MKRILALLLIGALLLSGCGRHHCDETSEIDTLIENEPILEEIIPESGDEKEQEQDPPPSDGKTEKPTKDPSPSSQQTNNSSASFEPNEEMTFQDALKIVEQKAHARKFNKKLTMQERKALYLYLTYENTMYLSAQDLGLISNYHHARKETIVALEIYTTQAAVGTDLIKEHPLDLSGLTHYSVAQTRVDQKVLPYEDFQEEFPLPVRLLKKQLSDERDYLANVTFSNITPQGRIRHQLTVTGAKGLKTQVTTMPAEMVAQVIRHYLSLEEVVWIELSHPEQEVDTAPTDIHRFWETEKEMPLEEARAIALEKANMRFNERLSSRERMAIYQLTKAYMDDRTQKHHAELLRLSTTPKGLSLAPFKTLPAKWTSGEYKPGFRLTQEASTVKGYTKNLKNNTFFATIPQIQLFGFKENVYPIYSVGQFTFTIHYAVRPDSYPPKGAKEAYLELLRHYLSIDCITWVGFTYGCHNVVTELPVA